MKIFSRNFWGTVLIWLGVVIFLIVIYDIIRPVFPGHPPYPLIQSIQTLFSRGETSPAKPTAAGPGERPPGPAAPPPRRSPRDSRMLTTNSHSPGGSYSQWVWEVKPEHRIGPTVRVEMAHAREGEQGGFAIVAYADTTGDGMPDRKVAESEFLTADQPGRWSAFTFTAGEEPLFIGSSWGEGKDSVIYRGNGEWPLEDSPLKGRFFYQVSGPGSRSAGPAYTNLRVLFSE